MKPLCIYHGNCADGFAAYWAVWKAHAGDIEGFSGVYQEDPPSVIGRDVVFVDFSYKRGVITKMSESASSITIIDHHKSAIEDLKDVPIAAGCEYMPFFDLDHSGAMLAWKYFFPEDYPPALLKYIEDRDLWRFRYANTRAIQANLFSFPYDIELWDTMMKQSDDPGWLHDFARAGEAIERKHFKDIEELLAVNTRYIMIGEIMVPVANLPYTMASDGAHILAKSHKGVGATYFQDKNGNYRFSLRSTDDACERDVDVSKLALQYGGGGHKHAAGFTLPYNQMKFNMALRTPPSEEATVSESKQHS